MSRVRTPELVPNRIEAKIASGVLRARVEPCWPWTKRMLMRKGSFGCLRRRALDELATHNLIGVGGNHVFSQPQSHREREICAATACSVSRR